MQSAVMVAVVILAVVAICRFLFPVNSRPGRGELSDGSPGHAANNPFHAVSIHPGENNCAAVETIQGKRYLSDEAPGLPLPDCNLAECHCWYKHHADRRSGTRDRRFGVDPETDVSEFWSLRDRRAGEGRRYTDLAST